MQAIIFAKKKMKQKTKPSGLFQFFQNKEKSLQIKMLVLCLESRNNISAVALVGSLVSFYMAVEDFATVTFTYPCYVQPFCNTTTETLGGQLVNCCGKNRNVSVHGDPMVCRI